MAGGAGFLPVYVRMVYLVRTNEKMHDFCLFLLDFSTFIPPRFGGLRKTRFVFRGPIWMRLNNSGNFCVGQVPRTSHVATRPKKHVSDASVPRCHGLLQQAPPQVCSWLVVEGIFHVYTRYLDTRTCSWTTRCTFLSLFSAGSSKQILDDCLLLLAAVIFLLFLYFSRFFLHQSVCTRAAWWLY